MNTKRLRPTVLVGTAGLLLAGLTGAGCNPRHVEKEDEVERPSVNVTIEVKGDRCVFSPDPVETHPDADVTFTNKTDCKISIAFGRVGSSRVFGVESLTLVKGESKTLNVKSDADGTYVSNLDCGSCDPSGGSSAPVIKVSPPPPTPPSP